MEFFTLIFTIILMCILLIIYMNYNYRKKNTKKKMFQPSYKHISINLPNNSYINELDDKSVKKAKLEKYFDLDELKKDIDYYNKKETILYFHCEKLISKYYSKLLLLNKEYELNENKIIEIKINKNELLNSDFNEQIILKSEKEEIKFVINICYNMNNHYQIILDKIENSLSLDIVLYSKKNNFPKNAIGDKFILKDYKDNIIPFLKKFNIINISREDFYKIYNCFSSKELDEKNKKELINKNSLFVNFIIKNENDVEGRIFEQEEETDYEEFTKEELELLEKIKKLTSNFTKDKIKILKDLIFFIYYEYLKIVENQENTIKSITSKFSNTCFFNKYYGKKIDEEELNLLDLVIFVLYIEERGISGINLYSRYLEHKNNIISDKFQFNNFEKLMLLINIQYLVLYFENFKMIKFCDLEINSPFIESEKLFFDIIKKLNENSALYFCYLQINSSSGLDYISSNTWFKIKFIPLNKIKAHLLYIRHPFFFIYEKADNKEAFVNPYNLIINFNVHPDTGYHYINSIENEPDDDNMIKILFLKFHESAHSKFECGMKYDMESPRYLLNFELKMLDSHYDSIAQYKRGGEELPNSLKKGINVGEEGYAIEIFLYESIVKTDYLLKYLKDLKQFNNVNLYIGDNFKDLNDIFHKLIAKHAKTKDYPKKNVQIEEIKARNIKTKLNVMNKEDHKEKKKTPLYFFKNFPIEANY